MADYTNVPPQGDAKPFTVTPVRHCGSRVPDALRGNLATGTCTLAVDAHGRHAGQHKAKYSAHPVGTVTFRWRTGWRKTSPPSVKLPHPDWGNGGKA